MTLVIPPGYAQVAWRFSLVDDPEPMITTCGAAVSGFGGGQDAADSLADLFCPTAFTAAGISISYVYLGARLAVGQDGGPPVIFEAVRSIAGSASAATVPQNCAFLVRKTTGTGGRSGRGRMFMPPFATGEDAVSAAGVLSLAAAEFIQGEIDTLFGGFSPYLLHDSSGTDTTPTPVTAMTLERQLATQRRRLRP